MAGELLLDEVFIKTERPIMDNIQQHVLYVEKEQKKTRLLQELSAISEHNQGEQVSVCVTSDATADARARLHGCKFCCRDCRRDLC